MFHRPFSVRYLLLENVIAKKKKTTRRQEAYRRPCRKSLAGGGVPTLAGVPPPRVLTYKQTGTITFPHPTDAGGKNPCI